MDIVKFIFRYIPPTITVDGFEYQFQMFINHAHYDFRFCYYCELRKKFMCLYENISSDAELIECLKQLREWLHEKKLLTGDYAEPGGYRKAIYNAWLRAARKR
jgi:hypothetical protein